MKLRIMSNGDVEEFDPNLLRAELALLRKRSSFFLLICSPLGKDCDQCQEPVCTVTN